MAATKQFLLNYDSNILLPYTTIDCILGKDNDDPDAPNIAGIDVITDNLLQNMKEFIYNNSENVIENKNQIKSSDISKAYVLGISTLKEGGAQVYTKFHELSLDSYVHAGHYLGADGTTHAINFEASSEDSSWYSTSIKVEPSNSLDNPIKAKVSINIKLDGDCFDTSSGKLYSKFSKNSDYAEKSNYASQANKIFGTDPSTGAKNFVSIGQNKAIQLNNGEFTAIAGIGGPIQPIYIDNNGFITKCSETVGSSNEFVYINNGEFKKSDSTIGTNNDTPIYLQNGRFYSFTNKVPTYTSTNGVGNTKTPIYIDENGIVKALTGNIGSSHNPVYLDSGVIKQCTLTPDSISCDGVDRELYLMADPSTNKAVWGKGNTTTAGSFKNTTNTVYYLVGIDSLNSEGVSGEFSGSFKLLTGAKRNDGTGIYFKNYELFQTSDENLKTFTNEIDINFDNLATIKKGVYYWTDDPNKISDIGIGARSLEALYPEIVDENDGVKTVAYNRLGVIALAAIDKLHLRVKELESEMKDLKAEIRVLKQGK